MNKTKINMAFSDLFLERFTIRSIVRSCIQTSLAAQGVQFPCEINVLITNDQGIHEINKATRDVDRPTDVLSFPMFQLEAGIIPEDIAPYLDPETGLVPLGDIVISFERAVAQAKEFGHSTRREIGYLTIHSILHLLGYDHLDEGEEKKQMREREEIIAGMIPRMQR